MDRNKFRSMQVDIQTSTWVDERMSALNADNNWQPNVRAGFERLTSLGASTQWIGKRTILLAAATTVAVCLSVMAYPSPKVFARRCISECKVVWQNLSLSARTQA